MQCYLFIYRLCKKQAFSESVYVCPFVRQALTICLLIALFFSLSCCLLETEGLYGSQQPQQLTGGPRSLPQKQREV